MKSKVISDWQLKYNKYPLELIIVSGQEDIFMTKKCKNNTNALLGVEIM